MRINFLCLYSSLLLLLSSCSSLNFSYLATLSQNPRNLCGKLSVIINKKLYIANFNWNFHDYSNQHLQIYSILGDLITDINITNKVIHYKGIHLFKPVYLTYLYNWLCGHPYCGDKFMPSVNGFIQDGFTVSYIKQDHTTTKLIRIRKSTINIKVFLHIRNLHFM